MASRRMIDPAFWESETVASFSFFERLLFIGLFSQADDQGRLKAHPALLSSRIFPFDAVAASDITAALDTFVQAESILVYAPNGKDCIQILNWWKYQKPRWAWPSDIPTPEGWTDRLHYRRGNTPVSNNWPGIEDTPAADTGESGATVGPERGHSGAAVDPAPSSRGSSSTRNSDRSSKNNAANAASPQPPPKTTKPTPKTAYTAGQRGFLEKHGAKRFKNGTQADAVLALEQEHGTKVLLEGATWTATNGMTLGKAILSLETALPKWGEPKSRGSPGDLPEAKSAAVIRAWADKQGV